MAARGPTDVGELIFRLRPRDECLVSALVNVSDDRLAGQHCGLALPL